MSKLTRIATYVLGKGFGTSSEGKPMYSWPYIVHYVPGHKTGDFYVGDGDARNGGGTFINARDLLQPQWRGHLETAGTLWLVPILERIANGETVEAEQMFAAYKQIHRTNPPIEEWDVYM